MKRYYKVLSIFILLFTVVLLLPKSFATQINNIYKAEDAYSLCQDVIANKVQIGVHSYYNDDTILAHGTSSCNNSAYFTNNIQGKVAGEDYPSYTYFARSDSTYKHFIEGIDVTNPDKYRYLYISYRSQAYDATTGEIVRAKNLKPGENIFVDIDLSDKNINSSNYSDLRVTFDYAYEDDIDIKFNSSIAYYVIDENDVKYGPYDYADIEIMKVIHYIKMDNSGTITTDNTVYDYKVVSDNLINDSLPTNTIIKKVRIVPYEDYPIQSGLFRLYSVSVDSYPNSYSNNKEYVGGIDSYDVRQNITNNMATNGAIKWGVNSARKLKFYCSICNSPKTFSDSHIYYGTPYVYDNEATVYSFWSQTSEEDGINKYNFATEYKVKEVASNGVEVEGETPSPILVYEEGTPHTDDLERRNNDLANYSYVKNTSDYLLGQHCSSSVYSAVGKELPFVVNRNLGSSRYIVSDDVRILDGIEIHYSDLEKELRERNILKSTDKTTATVLKQYYSDYIKENYTAEDIYNGYALMIPGDVSSRDLHTRMVTGYAHVECNDGTTTNHYTSYFCRDHGNINPINSYILITEVHTSHTNMSTHARELPRHVNQDEAGWTMTPDSRFTDITNVDTFYEEGNTKLTSFRFNRKVFFDDLYGWVDGSFDPEFDSESGAFLGDEEEAKTMYLPFRFKEMDRIEETGEVEKPRFRFVVDQEYNSDLLNAKLYSYLKNDHKLRGQIIANYLIDAIKIKINDETYYDYPNQTKVYSLYYGLQNEEVLTALNNLNYNVSNTISISILMGPNLQEVRNSLSLDNEGFMNVMTITTPGGKITPNFVVQNSLEVEDGQEVTIHYTYNGDGEITCVSANQSIATCTVNASAKTVKITSQNIGTVNITLNASEGEFYTSASLEMTVNVVGEQYTISFNANGGNGGQTDDIIANYGAIMPALITPAPTRTGYTFGGWYDTSESTGGIKYYNVDGTSARVWDKESNATLYARWIANTYTVSFNANGGNGGQSADVTVTYDSNMPSISSTKPTRNGYTFGGWYDTNESTGGTEYYTAEGVSSRTWNKTANTTLFARWTVNSYTVTFNSDGGTTIPEQILTYGSKVVKPTNPTKEGYDFKEWQLNGASYNFDSIVQSNITLTAIWERNTSLAEMLTGEGHTVTESYVTKFNLGMTIEQLRNELGSDVIIESNSSIISTGTIIRRGIERYTVVIKGDLTGEGKINSGDLLQMRRYLLEEIQLTGAFKQAGLIESQNDIKSLDLLRLRQYLLDEYVIR